MKVSLSSITEGFPGAAPPVYSFPEGIPATTTADPDSSVKTRPVISPREQAYQISGLLMIGDWAVSSAAIFAGLQLREWQRMGTIFDARHHIMASQMLLTWSVCGGAAFTWIMLMLKTYENTNLYRMQRMLKNLLRSILLWSVVIWAYIGLFRITDFTPRIGVLYCTVTLFGFLGLWRLISFTFLIQPSVKERVCSRAIVVGWNDTVSRLRKAMRRDLAQLDEIIGCVPSPSGLFGARPPPELAVLGDYAALPQIAAECSANSIILADCSCSAHEIQRLAAFCQRELLGFKMMVPEYFPALSSGVQVETVSGVPLLGVSKLPLDRTRNRVIKRIVDVCGAIIGLFFSAPVIFLFSLLVYLESPGPVIYRQRRTSRAGRTFVIWKIRSMKLDAEASTGAVWCTKKDDRRLRVGAFIRKYNIDELPQFWNVLKGDMSLVGPRPERPELIEKFKGDIPNYNARHEARAGLTGWAQIHGFRGDTDLTKRVEADLYYLENWSLMLDFYCMAATFFKNQNAH